MKWTNPDTRVSYQLTPLDAERRDDGCRRLLYDLDMTILELRQAYGEIPEAVRLAGTYHNLLRRWAEV